MSTECSQNTDSRHDKKNPGGGTCRVSLGPRPSRDSLTKEGLVSNFRFPGYERELCNST